jgi:FKBP-type peptidyl-prolyl cis-trans isomerase
MGDMMKSRFEIQTRMLSILALAGALLPAGLNAAAPEREDSSRIEAGARMDRPSDGAAMEKAGPIDSQKEKQSYALGMSVGMQLRHSSMVVDPDPFVQGLRDAISGGKTLLTVQESRDAVAEMQGDLKKRSGALQSRNALENKKAGEAFLAENKNKEGVVTLPGGLQYRILKAGDGKKPTLDDTVVAHYRGTLIDGKEFDSSYKRKAAVPFPLKQVIKGWADALQLMPVGSKWQLFVPPELAYGERGAGRKIGPNATLVFEVELVAIKDTAAAQSADSKASAAPDAGPTPQAPDKNTAAALTGINVSFKLDPRLTKSLYMGERWVSPRTYTNTHSPDGKTLTVEARAYGLDDKGQGTNISPSWIPADPAMVTVSPNHGNEVKITVQHSGTSKLKVESPGVSRELLITAKYEGGNAVQVDITQ